jgi:hypothetical protein
MNIEDFVSFNTTKLLNDKGFDWNCDTYYTENGSVKYTQLKYNHNGIKNCYSRPTLQVAMKWLREVHNLNVEVYRTACGYIGCIVDIPSGTDIKFLEDDGDDLPSGQYTKWEYACEAVIKYCLENLI